MIINYIQQLNSNQSNKIATKLSSNNIKRFSLIILYI